MRRLMGGGRFCPLAYGLSVGPGALQGMFHLLYGNQCCIIRNRIYFHRAQPSFRNPLYAVEPFQGCLAYVVSPDAKGDAGLCGLSKEQGGRTREGKHHDKSTQNKLLSYPCALHGSSLMVRIIVRLLSCNDCRIDSTACVLIIQRRYHVTITDVLYPGNVALL